MYLVFEGVSGTERLLAAIFRLTDLDVLWAPKVIGVHLGSEQDAQCFHDDPEILDMEDVPGGFWTMDVESDEYFLDRCEEAFVRSGCRRKKSGIKE